MQPSCGMTLIFLLLRLQWNRINTEAGEVKETSKGNSSITKNHQSPVQLNSERLVVHMTTTVSPSTTSHAPPAVANIKENVVKRTEIISGAKSRSLRPSDGTTFSSNVSKNWNNSATNIHRMSCAKLEQQVTKRDQKCCSYISFHNGTESFHSHPYHPWGFSAPSDNSSVKPTTLFPISVIRTSPMVKQDSPTPNFNPIQQTTKLNHNSSNPPTASPKDANEEKNNKEEVRAGISAGAILGSVLIGLVGYFICATKRPESFSHRNLYVDTRSDPVLH